MAGILVHGDNHFIVRSPLLVPVAHAESNQRGCTNCWHWQENWVAYVRHTCATLLRASGADIKVVQELLRHASCRVTLDTYTQAVTEQKRAAQNKIAGLVHGHKPRTHQMYRVHGHSQPVSDKVAFSAEI